MSNNTTGCINANMVSIKHHVNPIRFAMQPFGISALLCRGDAVWRYGDTVPQHRDMAGVIT